MVIYRNGVLLGCIIIVVVVVVGGGGCIVGVSLFLTLH